MEKLERNGRGDPIRTCVAGELHPGVALLEGHDEGGEVNHAFQLPPRFCL